MIPVSVHGIAKAFGSTAVLAQTELAIAPGELFFLLGRSGCGKTTLLRIIAGFIAPDAGSVRFGPDDVTRLPPERRSCGMVFQHYALFPHLSVAANVAFGLEAQGLPRAECERRVEEALHLVELHGLGERRIGELSGGQQQRVALARAIAPRPRLLLLDEPLSNLDARLRVQMRQEIRRLCKSTGLTAIQVTHDQGEALSTADRIALMDSGRIVQVGAPRALYDRPATRFSAEFLGEANLLSGIVRRDTNAIATPIGVLPAQLPSGLRDGDTVSVCIRPERLRIVADVAPGPARIAATLIDGVFLGSQAQWRVRIGPAAAPGSMLLAASPELTVAESAAPPRQAGDRLMLSLQREDVVVLHEG